MRRYASLFFVQLRASFATAAAYRADFLVDGLMSLWWIAWTTTPLLVVFHGRETVVGWSFEESFIVVAWFTVLRGILEGAINPSLIAVSDHIRMGTFDFVLIKPVDAQFLVSTQKFAPWKIIDVLAGVAFVVISFARMGRAPDWHHVALAALLLLAAVLVLYSIWILVVCASFWVIRLDNLAYLFTSIFDAARWPLKVFPGVWRIIFTFVIPLGLMTTYPAEAILGRLDLKTALGAFGGAVAFAIIARLIWKRAIGHYTSASS